ncbi:BBP7 family outer membrane beta-barrel protein [Planctomyces sp. SH-PL14]|uniref:BBP7 family outer membrane beta-barrel protein n=1 Tax=Planctomyces sp. SH-PL14 TaxID=1632864 RepID=UPI00078E6FD8|nr:BBP7 family outer membrane beta-barrel protein [Planctomyces sp. SH-PL14]AMV16675.1 hypothetical protein VT03_02220 [Planctomyces sp. SH-PL14]
MTRWFITTLVLTCLGTWSHACLAQDYFGPEGYSVPPELLPTDRGFLYDTNSELDLNIREGVENSYWRLEYLNWSLTEPGDVFLGAPLASFERQGNFPPTAIQGPNGLNSNAFPVVTGLGTRGGAFGFVPSLADANFDNQNGIKGTFGVNFEPFTFEGSVWALDQETQTLNFAPNFTFGAPYFPVITYLREGALSDSRMTPFEGNYTASVQANLWGADTNFLLRPLQPGNPISVRPLFGLKYIRYTNSLTISGFDAIENLNPTISSRAENNTFGPQAGLRFAYDTKYFSLAADPKVTFGINRHIDRVSTAQLFSPTEEPTSQQEEKTDFSPVFDLGVSGRIHMSANLSAFVSYNLMIIGRQSTSWENVYYNSPQDPLADPAAVGISVNKNIMMAHGITVGAEFRFR